MVPKLLKTLYFPLIFVLNYNELLSSLHICHILIPEWTVQGYLGLGLSMRALSLVGYTSTR